MFLKTATEQTKNRYVQTPFTSTNPLIVKK